MTSSSAFQQQRGPQQRNRSQTHKSDEHDSSTLSPMLLASEQQQPLYAQGGLLHSLPYFHSFQTTVKGRWIGRRLCDVFAEEFPSLGGLPYALRAFQAGKLRVTGAPSSKSSSAGNGGGGRGLKMDDLSVDDPSNPKKKKRKNADNGDGSKGIKNNREICRGGVAKAAECGGSTVDGGDKGNQAVCGFYDSPHVDDIHQNETSNYCRYINRLLTNTRFYFLIEVCSSMNIDQRLKVQWT